MNSAEGAAAVQLAAERKLREDAVKAFSGLERKYTQVRLGLQSNE